MIELEQICDANKKIYQSFETVFNTNLSKYQSRIFPNVNAEMIQWYYIKYAGEYIGSIWLEKMQEVPYAVLGVFIAYKQYRNRGIGKESIKRMLCNIDEMGVNEVRLHVREQNVRAIKCYYDIGFRETKKYQKENGPDVLEMVYTRHK